VTTDFCTSCTVQAISDTQFLFSFDCSNRLVGNCVGFDTAGVCIDNSGAPLGTVTPTPAPFPVTVTPMPTPFPVTVTPTPAPFSVTVTPMPTPFPVTVTPTPTPFPVTTVAPLSPPTSFPITTTTSAPRSPPTSLPVSAPTLLPTHTPPAVTPLSIDGTNAPTDSINAPSNQGGGKSKSVVGVAVGGVVGGVALAVVVGVLVLWSQRHQTSKTTKPDNVPSFWNNQNTESNTDDDFASSRSPTTFSGYSMGGTSIAVTAALVQPSPMMQQPSPMHPITEVPSKRDVFVPTPDMPPAIPYIEATQNSVSSLSSSSQRLVYPANHVLNVKDQCRSVAMVRPSSSQSDNSHIPFAVALGVSTTSSVMASVVSSPSSNGTKKKPSRRILMDV
jgi:hypothetical protein